MNSIVLSGKLRAQARVGRRNLLKFDERGHRIGESHHAAKLSDAQVDQILDLRALGRSYRSLAAEFDCSIHTVESICQFRRRSITPARVVEKK